MKISYRTHPALEMLATGKMNRIGFYELDAIEIKNSQIHNIFYENFKLYFSFFSKRIRFISAPFSDAIDRAMSKMMEDEIWDNTEEQYGTLINKGLTIFYALGKHEKNIPSCRCFFVFKGSVLIHFSAQEGAGEINPKMFCWTSPSRLFANKEMFIKNGISEKRAMINEMDNIYYTMIVSTLNFIKYCPIETKILPAGRKVVGIKCNYKNETKNIVEVIDSLWCTNLVNQNGFSVRGHYRWQPKKKEEEWTKELIWIAPFEKTGYTAPARKSTTTA